MTSLRPIHWLPALTLAFVLHAAGLLFLFRGEDEPLAPPGLGGMSLSIAMVSSGAASEGTASEVDAPEARGEDSSLEDAAEVSPDAAEELDSPDAEEPQAELAVDNPQTQEVTETEEPETPDAEQIEAIEAEAVEARMQPDNFPTEVDESPAPLAEAAPVTVQPSQETPSMLVTAVEPAVEQTAIEQTASLPKPPPPPPPRAKPRPPERPQAAAPPQPKKRTTQTAKSAPRPTATLPAEVSASKATTAQGSGQTDTTAAPRGQDGEQGKKAGSGGADEADLSGRTPVGTPSASYMSRLRYWLERHKTYPKDARRARMQGVVHLSFRVDRHGKVLKHEIRKPSGYKLLDGEATAMLERAQPLPKFTDGMSGDYLDVVVPVSFSLRGNR